MVIGLLCWLDFASLGSRGFDRIVVRTGVPVSNAIGIDPSFQTKVPFGGLLVRRLSHLRSARLDPPPLLGPAPPPPGSAKRTARRTRGRGRRTRRTPAVFEPARLRAARRSFRTRRAPSPTLGARARAAFGFSSPRAAPRGARVLALMTRQRPPRIPGAGRPGERSGSGSARAGPPRHPPEPVARLEAAARPGPAPRLAHASAPARPRPRSLRECAHFHPFSRPLAPTDASLPRPPRRPNARVATAPRGTPAQAPWRTRPRETSRPSTSAGGTTPTAETRCAEPSRSGRFFSARARGGSGRSDERASEKTTVARAVEFGTNRFDAFPISAFFRRRGMSFFVETVGKARRRAALRPPL